MYTQKGFAHAFIILGLVFFIGFALSVAFMHNFVKQQPKDSSSGVMASNATVPSVKPLIVKNKTYTSLSSSGLTFDYPETWSFVPPTKETFSRSNMKGTIFTLYSQKPTTVNGKSEIANENMCVSLFEMQGSWPFQSQAPTGTESIADLTVGHSKVILVENKANLASGVDTAMQLLTQDSASKHGAAYVALNNEYYLLAKAGSNCFSNGHPEKKDLTTDIEQTKAILKSVRITN
jgi:hypothetical protein